MKRGSKGRESRNRSGWKAFCLGATLLLGLGQGGCAGDGGGPTVGAAAMAWDWQRAAEWPVLATSEAVANHPGWEAMQTRLVHEMGPKFSFGLLADAKADREATILVGLASDPAMQPHLENLGVRVREKTWALHDLAVAKRVAWILASWQDPSQGGRPITVLCAETEAGLTHGLTRLRPGSWSGMRIYEGVFPAAESRISPSGVSTRKSMVDCRPWFRIRSWRGDLTGRTVAPFEVFASPEVHPESADAYAKATALTWQRLEDWAGKLAPRSARIYVQALAYHWHLGPNSQAWANVDVLANRIQALVPNGHLGDAGAESGRAYLVKALGQPKEPWLANACALQASGMYWGVPLGEWWPVLAGVHALPPPTEWGPGSDFVRRSPHLVQPLLALLVQLVWEDDPAQLLRLWGEPLAASAWSPYLERVGTRLGELAAAKEPSKKSGLVPGVGVALRGGLDPGAPGLGSLEHEAALAWLAEAGANWVAYDLHVTAKPHQATVQARPWAMPAVLGDVRGEPLLGLALLQARAMGLERALSLEVWARPSGALLLDLVWPDADWTDRFFDQYEVAAEHAALTARLFDVSLLSLGEGAAEVLRIQPFPKEEEHPVRMAVFEKRQERWRELLDSVRPLYPGTLTIGVSSAQLLEPQVVREGLDVPTMAHTVRLSNWLQGRRVERAAMARQWQRRLANLVKSLPEGPYVVWPLSPSAEIPLEGAPLSVGIPPYRERAVMTWEAFHVARIQGSIAWPTLVILGALDLGADPGPGGAAFSREDVQAALGVSLK